MPTNEKNARLKGKRNGGHHRPALRALPFLLGFLAIMVASRPGFFPRFDLTADKRFTLNPATKQQLQTLEEPVYITSYLEGEMPLEFKRLKASLEQLIEEYRIGSGYRLHYKTQNPNREASETLRDAQRARLIEMGAKPLTVRETGSDGSASETLLFPTLSIGSQGRSTVVNILTTQPTLDTEQSIALAIQSLEYTITAAINRVTRQSHPRVIFLQGDGLTPPLRSASLARELAQDFQVEKGALPTRIGGLDDFRIAVLSNPSEPFSELEKLVLDQYLMQGGRLLVLASPVAVALDSLRVGETTLALQRSLNLHDLFFRYGVRVNPVILQDLQCALIPVNTALAGQQPRFTPMPWCYFPLLTPTYDSYISRNINLVYSQFPSAIDFVGQEDGIKKTPLLTTTPYSRSLQAPLKISLSQIAEQPLPRDMQSGPYIVGALLEGSFGSAFRNRPLEAIAPGQSFHFTPQSAPAKIAIFADGSIGENGITTQGGRPEPLPLGFDRYTNQSYGNAELLLNTALALDDREEILQLRGRQLLQKRLDKNQAINSRLTYQIINCIVPPLLLIIGGGTGAALRRRRYTARPPKARANAPE